MSYEETLDVSARGNTAMQQRGSGHLAVPVRRSDTEPRSRCARSEGRAPWVNQRGRGVCRSVLEPRRASGKAHGGKPRSEPDWGKPTVRDRRGACGNVVSMGAGLRPNGKSLEKPPDPTVSARRTSIPTLRCGCAHSQPALREEPSRARQGGGWARTTVEAG